MVKLSCLIHEHVLYINYTLGAISMVKQPYSTTNKDTLHLQHKKKL